MHDSTVSELTPPSEKLTLATKLAFGAGDVGPAITANVLVFFLLYFFTQVAGIPAGLAGSILMIGKISDAINDPIIGMLSDRSHTVFGRRLPWMLWGSIPFSLLFFCQWLVPHFSENKGVNDWFLFAYYVAIGVLFNVFYTVVNLPYTALTPELTQDYNERTKLNSLRFGFSIGASIFSLILAGVVFKAYPGDPLKQYWILGLICSVFSFFALIWCALRLQERGVRSMLNVAQKHLLSHLFGFVSLILIAFGGVILTSGGNGETHLFGILGGSLGLFLAVGCYSFRQSEPEFHLITKEAIAAREVPEEVLPFKQQLSIVFRNKPFLYVIGIYLFSWLAIQLTASILPYFVISYMKLPDAVFPQVALMVQGTALILLFIFSYFSEQWGKKVVYFIGVGIWIIAQGGLFFLQPNQVGLMYFLAFLAGFGVSVGYLIPWSMVPDVIELDELETGRRREGVFYGFMVLLQKIGLAISLFLVGQALEWNGFIASMAGEPAPIQPDSALFAIRVAIGPLPTLTLFVGLVLAYYYPITQSFHNEIRLKLQEKKASKN